MAKSESASNSASYYLTWLRKISILEVLVKVYNITSDYIVDVKPSKSEITEFQNR